MIKFIKSNFNEICRFLVIGVGATLVDYLVMAITLYLFNARLYSHNFINVFFGNAHPTTSSLIIATALGVCVGIAFNYIFSVAFVFKENQKAKTKTGALVFVLLALVGFFIHTLGMFVMYDILHINEWISKIFLTAVVLVFNYLSRKLLLFNNKEN